MYKGEERICLNHTHTSLLQVTGTGSEKTKNQIVQELNCKYNFYCPNELLC